MNPQGYPNDSPLGSYPAGNNSPIGSYPAGNNSPLGSYPAANNSPLGSYPATNNSPIGSYPADNNSPLGSYPAANNSPLGSYPAGNNSPLGSYPIPENTPAPMDTSPIAAPAAEQPSASEEKQPAKTRSKRKRKKRKPSPSRYVFWGWLLGSLLITVLMCNNLREWWTIIFFSLQAAFGIMTACCSKASTRLKNMLIFMGIEGVFIVAVTILRLTFPAFFAALTVTMDVALFGVLFCILGVLLPLVFCRNQYFLKKCCTEPVEAVCIGLTRKHHADQTKHRATFSPTYEYSYNGKTITARRDTSSNFGNPRVGRPYRLFIDPRHPTKFYEPHYARAEITVFSIGGFIFFALGWFLIIGHTIQTVPMG